MILRYFQILNQHIIIYSLCCPVSENVNVAQMVNFATDSNKHMFLRNATVTFTADNIDFYLPYLGMLVYVNTISCSRFTAFMHIWYGYTYVTCWQILMHMSTWKIIKRISLICFSRICLECSVVYWHHLLWP